MMKALLLLALCLALVSANYAGHKVVRAYLENEKQLAVINSWELDVWSRDSSLALGWNDIMVNDGHMASLLSLEVPFDIIIDDVEEHLSEGHRDLEQSRTNMHHGAMLADFFTAYHTYDEIGAYLTNLTTVYSNIAKLGSVGTTIQGRTIYGLTITGTATGTKKKIFFSGGQHAREWIAPATTLYLLTQLITRYSSDATVKALLDSTIFHVVPLVNPDGYVYTWGGTSQRLWRKNRRANTGGSYGVDLNRNWDDHWGGEGSSGTPTSDTYRGTAPFSEPESKAVSAYITANGPFAGGIDYHSYSQLILRPWGWTNQPPANEGEAKTVGDTIRARILSVNNVAYTSQGSWQLYYASGGASDWFLSKGRISLSYTIELRDTGAYGFQLPASQIKPTGAENWAGFLYFAQVAK
jgi:murein tripeptide amidase MpaA